MPVDSRMGRRGTISGNSSTVKMGNYKSGNRLRI